MTKISVGKIVQLQVGYKKLAADWTMLVQIGSLSHPSSKS